MTDYDIFSKTYDTAMGDRSDVAELLRELVRKNNPGAKSVLELACGTGAILRRFARDYAVTGVDLSKGMLTIARKELPNVKFLRRDITNFRLNKKFDAIICVYDSINHILDFEGWEKVFANANAHLAEGGVFIFDINTLWKLRNILTYPPEIHKLGEDYMILKVRTPATNMFNWNVKFFEHRTGANYRLRVENIRETSFHPEKIKKALKPYFKSVHVIDADRKSPSKLSERLYFVCKN